MDPVRLTLVECGILSYPNWLGTDLEFDTAGFAYYRDISAMLDV